MMRSAKARSNEEECKVIPFPLRNYTEINHIITSFIVMIAGIKTVDGVDEVYMFSTKDLPELQLYVFMQVEDLEKEDEILKHFVEWEMETTFFPEIHILPYDRINSKEEYLPENAIRL